MWSAPYIGQKYTRELHELNIENVHPELAQVALEKVEGFAFERFTQDFLSVLEGREFVPVGGTKDGGADG